VDVALASCRILPEPDGDEEPLVRALRAEGLSAEVLAWDDPGAPFAEARLTLLRATWNYPDDPEGFLGWAERTSRVSVLRNPLGIVRWNLHKSYLLDLERAGVPVVPTLLARRGEGAPLARLVEGRGWRDVVVKPAVSAASRKTLRAAPGDAEAHFRALVRGEDVLVQPYLPSVEGYGERALVWIDGRVTHAVRKSRRFAGDVESVASAGPIPADEVQLAERAIAAIPEGLRRDGLLYARVDMARDADGSPRVMELELIEPSLFFRESEEALARFVGRVVAALGVDERGRGGHAPPS
jgi:glutathione synthase/RimK-type ligase-like ATP-grasp enzyme